MEGIIFDIDGVLVDTQRQYNEGWIWSLSQYGKTISEELLASFQGSPSSVNKAAFDKVYCGTVDYEEARCLRNKYILKVREREGISPKAGLTELFNEIRKIKIPCAVATASADIENIQKTLQYINIYGDLCAVITGNDVKHGKPNPDIFLKAAEKLKVNPKNCIVVEDSINGIIAGHRAGMRVIHIPDTIVIDEKTRLLTWKICKQLNDIIPLLN